jgi:transcriptional antiterminator NusG
MLEHQNIQEAQEIQETNNDSEVAMTEEKHINLRWYIIHVYSGLENSVKKNLTERIKNAGLDDFFGEILVPTEEIMEVKEGSRNISERRFFPGYVFVQMEMNEKTWHLVRSTSKISGFVGGTPTRPAPVSEREIARIKAQVQDNSEKPRYKVLFEIGEVLRIKEGPFADFNGTIEEVNYERSRLWLSVSIFGRATPVDLDFNQVEKIA